MASFDAALARFGLAGAPRTHAAYTFAEQVARIATDPTVSGILLAIGFLGLLIELQTLHGIAGAIGAGVAGAVLRHARLRRVLERLRRRARARRPAADPVRAARAARDTASRGRSGALILVASVLLAFGLPFFVGALQALAVAIVLSASRSRCCSACSRRTRS